MGKSKAVPYEVHYAKLHGEWADIFTLLVMGIEPSVVNLLSLGAASPEIYFQSKWGIGCPRKLEAS